MGRGIKRGRGKKPSFRGYLFEFVIGDVPQCKEAIRQFKGFTVYMRINIVFQAYSQEYEGKDFSNALDKALKMIENSSSDGSKDGPTNESASPIEQILYFFSHENIETFLSSKPLNFLFRKFITLVNRDKAYEEAKNLIPLD